TGYRINCRQIEVKHPTIPEKLPLPGHIYNRHGVARPQPLVNTMAYIMHVVGERCRLNVTTPTCDRIVARKSWLIEQSPTELKTGFSYWISGKIVFRLREISRTFKTGKDIRQHVIPLFTGYHQRNQNSQYQQFLHHRTV